MVPPQFLVSCCVCSAFSSTRPYCNFHAQSHSGRCNPHLPHPHRTFRPTYLLTTPLALPIHCTQTLPESPAKSSKPSNGPFCLESLELFWRFMMLPHEPAECRETPTFRQPLAGPAIFLPSSLLGQLQGLPWPLPVSRCCSFNLEEKLL